MIVLMVFGVELLYGGRASVASVCIWKIRGFAAMSVEEVLASVMLRDILLLVRS